MAEAQGKVGIWKTPLQASVQSLSPSGVTVRLQEALLHPNSFLFFTFTGT